MNKNYILTSIILSSLAMGGCDTFRNTFGLDHYSPNEWSAAEPSPGLILPPDFKSRPKLPPPAPGSPNPHAVSATVKAQKTVLGSAPDHTSSPAVGRGEADIVEKASENQPVTPGIRKIVDEEAQEDDTVSAKVISKIKSWKKEAATNLRLPKSGDNHSKDEGATNTQEKEGES